MIDKNVHIKTEMPARFMAQFTDEEAFELDKWGLENRIRARSKILRALSLKGLEASKNEAVS